MPTYDKAIIGRIAKENEFVRDTFKKVLRLKDILKFMNQDELFK